MKHFTGRHPERSEGSQILRFAQNDGRVLLILLVALTVVITGCRQKPPEGPPPKTLTWSGNAPPKSFRVLKPGEQSPEPAKKQTAAASVSGKGAGVQSALKTRGRFVPPAYSFRGERYRDPFSPLIGGGAAINSNAVRVPALSQMMLKGIIQDGNERTALITAPGGSYTIRGGRLYDGRNRLVPGISGVVKSNSITLFSSTGMRQINLIGIAE